MEAYCNAVRLLEDKFDCLELNHVPRNYNEDGDELAKIASGQTTVPPNIFARDIIKPSVDFKNLAEPGPSNAEPPGGNPSADEAEPMDTDFKTSSMDEAKAMEIDEAPPPRDWRTQLEVRVTEAQRLPRAAEPVSPQGLAGPSG
ncbi:uncharacterized protein LOC120659549 [Panicum virgatum]|uniref:uncharacterized protein LOC120659549 n=1 Tax=Panicum virgatum TaxID=38727 RepID=UPI0019D55FA7|nr:uncharacterized protein LOC120659549 [Panicum virgatum]